MVNENNNKLVDKCITLLRKITSVKAMLWKRKFWLSEAACEASYRL